MVREDPQRIELRPALAWTCEECGRDNYEALIILQETSEETLKIAAEMGVDSLDLAIYPDIVICAHCGSDFEVEPFEGM